MNNKKIVSSLLYKFTEKVLVKAIGFVIGVILARLLDPEIFGIVAIITAVVAIAQVFVDSGLSTALVQSKSVTEGDYSTIFYISFGVALVAYLLIFLLTPVIAHYYHIEAYTTQLRVLTATLFFYAFNSIQTAKLQREMAFRKMLVCQLVAVVVSGCVGIVLAYWGYGVWALIFYYLSSSAAACITYAVAARWHPRLTFSKQRAKELVNYSYKILLSGLLCSLFANLRTFIIGRIYSKAELGVYSRGDQIPSVISSSIDSAFHAVMLPAFSKEQDNFSKVKDLLSKTIIFDSILIFPAMLGLASVAKNLVLVLYTAKWSAAIPFIQILSLAYIGNPVASPCLVAIKAIGRSDVYLKLETVRRIVMLVILFASLLFHSLIAIAIGWLLSSVVDMFIIMIPVSRLLHYSFGDMWKDIKAPLFISISMVICVLVIGKLPLSPLPLLILQILGGVIVYLGASLLFMPQILKTAVSLIRKK